METGVLLVHSYRIDAHADYRKVPAPAGIYQQRIPIRRLPITGSGGDER